ncbi:MAG: hypothetical protein ACREDP_06980, partial [Bradyrhizobium sp.]
MPRQWPNPEPMPRLESSIRAAAEMPAESSHATSRRGHFEFKPGLGLARSTPAEKALPFVVRRRARTLLFATTVFRAIGNLVSLY